MTTFNLNFLKCNKQIEFSIIKFLTRAKFWTGSMGNYSYKVCFNLGKDKNKIIEITELKPLETTEL